jgi:uridine kinase
MPPAPSAARAEALDRIVDLINARGDQRLRVGIDGFTAAGKTSLGHELARGLAERGRTTLRASLDDFKRPWSEAHRYDRLTGEGYYRNAFDIEAIRRLLLDPADPNGDGTVALCGIDPLTQLDHSAVTTAMPTNGVLVVDGVFAFRPEIDDAWDLRIWVDIDTELSVRRGTQRDAEMEGSTEEAEALHRARYLAAELLYLEEVDPRSFVDVIVDNTDFDRPTLVRPAD